MTKNHIIALTSTIMALTLWLAGCSGSSSSDTMSYDGFKSTVGNAVYNEGDSRGVDYIELKLESSAVIQVNNYQTGQPVDIPEADIKVGITASLLGKKIDLLDPKTGYNDMFEIYTRFNLESPVYGVIRNTNSDRTFDESIKSGTLLVERHSDDEFSITIKAKTIDGKDFYASYRGIFSPR